MVSLSIWHWLIIALPIAIPLILKFGFNIGAKPVPMRNPTTGQLKNGYYGFSWTYWFFGWFVPLFRGELGVAALHLLFSVCTFGLWQFVVSFLYNKQYTNRLITQGFMLHGSPQENVLAAQSVGLDLPTHQARLR